MKRISVLIVLSLLSFGMLQAQNNEWQNLGEKAGLMFMYKVSECETGGSILLRIINPGSTEPVYEKFVIEVDRDGQIRNFSIDLSKLEQGKVWEGNCEENNRSLRLVIGDVSAVSNVKVKLPSEI